jgi:hypothetical protein
MAKDGTRRPRQGAVGGRGQTRAIDRPDHHRRGDMAAAYPVAVQTLPRCIDWCLSKSDAERPRSPLLGSRPGLSLKQCSLAV